MRRRDFGVVSATVLAVVIAGTGLPATATAAPPEEKGVQSRSDGLNVVWSPPDEAATSDGAPGAAPDEAWAPKEDRVLASGDDGQVGAFSAPAGTVVGAPGLGALPYYSFDTTNISLDSVARVNLGNGNLLVTASDGFLNGPGLSLRNDRFYNGLSSSNGSFGGGWSSSLSAFDSGLSVTSTQATFTGPNGFTATFTKNGTEWDAPDGFNATLTASGSNYVLTYNKTGDELTFNSSGWLLSEVNRSGVGSTYSYSTSGEVERVEEASGRHFDILWTTIDGERVIDKIEDSADRAFDYGVNSTGSLNWLDAPGGYWEWYRYDSTGRMYEIQMRGTGGASTDTRVSFTYDAQHRVIEIEQGTASSSAALSTTTYAYSAGQTTVTDARGKTATYAIDSLGRVTSSTDALGRTRSQEWTANSDIAASTDAFASGSTPGNSTTYTYDQRNNAIGTTLPTGAAASAAYTTGVGCAGTGGTVFQVKCSTDAAGAKKSYDYDANGNLTTVTDTTSGGTGAVSQQYSYETNGSICGGFAGQVCTATDGNNNITSYAYDADGNLISVTPPAPQGDTTYTYDSLGRVLSVTDGNDDTTSYTYNLRDDILTTTFEGDETVTTTTSSTTTSTMSAASTTAVASTLTVTYYGNRLKATETDSVQGTKTYSWDRLGRLITEQGPGTAVENYEYDAVGNLVEFIDDYGTVKHVYDDANQLIQTLEGFSSSCPATGSPADSGCIRYGYDANGAETSRTFPGNATVTTTRDPSGRATRIVAKDSAGATVTDVGYSYAAAGQTGTAADRTNIQTRTSFAEVAIPAGAVTSYGYDSLNRLTSAIEKNGTTTNASWAYSYDDAGNRTQQVRTGNTGKAAGTIGYSYDAANRLTSTTADTSTWTYDAAGNQTRNGITGQTSSYDGRGAVTAIGSTAYTAFGSGNTEQLSRSSLSTSYTNTALGLTQETLSGGAVRAYTRTAAGDVVSTRFGGGSKYYYIQDSLGSVIGLFDKNGAFAGGYSYSPYGEQRNTVTAGSGADANSLRYISGYADRASGLYKLGARYYDSSIGRFTQYDPSGQESNPYAYGNCNPLAYSDPSGLGAVCTFGPIGNAAVGVLAAGIGFAAVGAAATVVLAPLALPLAITAGALAVGVSVTAFALTAACTFFPQL